MSNDDTAREPRRLVISRHSTTIAWLKEKKAFRDFEFHSSFREAVGHVYLLGPGDIVCGSFSLRLAARICEAGAEYWHLYIRKKMFSDTTSLGSTELDRSAFVTSYFIKFNDEVVRP